MFGKTFQHPTSLVQRVIEYVTKFMKVIEMRSIGWPTIAVTREMKWKALEPGWLKANCDASIVKNQGRMGFGVVVRDEK